MTNISRILSRYALLLLIVFCIADYGCVSRNRMLQGKGGIEKSKTDADTNKVKCPACGYENIEGSAFCARCGELLSGESEPEYVVNPKCASCGFVNEEGAAHCAKCGKPLTVTMKK